MRVTSHGTDTLLLEIGVVATVEQQQKKPPLAQSVVWCFRTIKIRGFESEISQDKKH